VLRSGDATITGAVPAQVMRLVDICDLAAERPVWRERDRAKEQRRLDHKLYGVGFALANQAFGTGADGVMAQVSISRQGEISIRTSVVDMGNGSATTLAVGTSTMLGRNASAIHMGDTTRLGAALGFDRSTARGHDWSDPHWTPVQSGPSSACLTAFHHTHAVEQAALALFCIGILPAARSLWDIAEPAHVLPKWLDSVSGLGDDRPLRWDNGRLAGPGLRPLGHAELAAEIYRKNVVSSVTIHALHVDRWVRADYDVDGYLLHLASDGLSTRLANAANWRRHARRNVVAPAENAFLLGRNLYTPSGALVAVEIERTTGHVAVVDVETFLDAGRVIQPDIVAGQSDGGVAMGIGFALMEDASNGEDGPGNGRWNLHRYQVPLARHVPIGNMKLTLLGGGDATAKGIAEAVLCPIPAAIANAVAHATGHPPRSLPITPDWIRKVVA
jgi:CO/xanthine dehydrogenase Mo-binding subunit